MKARINGHKYDTDTAGFVARYSVQADELRYSFTQTLFYKKTGEFFIYSRGGDRDEEDFNNEYWIFRPEIVPLSFQEAKRWAQLHCSKCKFITLFGDENDEKPNKSSLSSIALLKKRTLKALPYTNK